MTEPTPKDIEAARKLIPKDERNDAKWAFYWGIRSLNEAIKHFQKTEDFGVDISDLEEYREEAQYAHDVIKAAIELDQKELREKQAKCKHKKTHPEQASKSDDSYSTWTYTIQVCNNCGKVVG